METKIIRLSEPGSEQHHFPFQIGQRVRSKVDGRRGVIKDVELETAQGWSDNVSCLVQFSDEEESKISSEDLEEA